VTKSASPPDPGPNETGSASPSPAPPAAAAAPPAEGEGAKPRPKPKPPAPEDSPFEDFVPGQFLPALARELQAYGGPETDLSFEQGPMPVVGSSCWMVRGTLPGERRFWLCFTEPDINSAKTVALAEGEGDPSLLESFLIDERKMTLPLLVSRLVQRLNGQKWLGPN
jgi:hypothetical protein